MKKVIIPLPSVDFDPSEVAIPWQVIKKSGIQIIFATPTAKAASCDPRMLKGSGLGPFKWLLQADLNSRSTYEEMFESFEFNNPISWEEINPKDYAGIILPGGHAKGMKEYLESKRLQDLVSYFFANDLPVGAICHGVVLAARSKDKNGKSVLYNKSTTCLLRDQELSAWLLTCSWLGNYYRTYPQTVEAEVKACLKSKKQFSRGPLPFKRDSLDNQSCGFALTDGNYISARWPGDVHVFSLAFTKLLK